MRFSTASCQSIRTSKISRTTGKGARFPEPAFCKPDDIRLYTSRRRAFYKRGRYRKARIVRMKSAKYGQALNRTRRIDRKQRAGLSIQALSPDLWGLGRQKVDDGPVHHSR